MRGPRVAADPLLHTFTPNKTAIEGFDMGKGDRKTAKGKRYNSSYGNARPKAAGLAAGAAPVAKKAAAKPVAKAPAKKAAVKKVAAKD
jgi:30S ribosomal protein S31